MTDSTDDVDWYMGPEQDWECESCAKMRRANAALREQDEIHWKTRRSLLADIERLRERVRVLEEAARYARQEIAKFPHSLGYGFDVIPKLDAALQEKQP